MRPLRCFVPGILSLALVGCTRHGSALDADIEAASSTSEAEQAPPPASEPAPEPVPPPAPTPTLIPGGPALGGFAIYTEAQTVVLAYDGSDPVIGEGLWLQDDRSSPPALSHSLIIDDARARHLELPGCACVGLAGAYPVGQLERRSFDPRTGALREAPDPPARCVRRPETIGFPTLEIDGEVYEPCAGAEDEIVMALVGGQLLYQGWDWNGACHGGMSLYDATDSRVDLIAEPPQLSSKGMRSLGCDLDFGPALTARAWPVDAVLIDDDDCTDYHEAESFMLRRGDLWAVRDDIGHAHGFRHYLKRRARPDSCPSVNDPCGDPEPFRKRAKLSRRSREFWIATDGSAALTAIRDNYALWLADAETALEVELPDFDATRDVLGVRAHADIRPLLAVMAKHPKLGHVPVERAPTTVEPEVCRASYLGPDPQLGARELGNSCFEYIAVEQWMQAEAACLHGLALTQEPGTRGALYYNLGRIAEAQRAVEQAAAHYRNSLAVRPGNEIVERKLKRLRLPG